ncbi:MAG: hypothetical protein ABI628_09030 [Chloroflexota bacterium]
MTGPTEPSPPPAAREPGASEPEGPTDSMDPAHPAGSTDPAERGRIPGGTGPPEGRQRLAHSPGDRFRRVSQADAAVASGGSPVRAVAMGIVAALIGVGIFLVLAIVYTFTAGLVIVAVFTGRFIGLFVRAGADGSLGSPARTLISIVIFLVALSVASLTTWLVAGLEGGVLPLGDYLEQTYGTPIVALEFMLGTLMAWWAAR